MPEFHIILPVSAVEAGSCTETYSIAVFGIILVLAAVIPAGFLRCLITTGEKNPNWRQGRSIHELFHTVETSELIGSPITGISDFH